MASIAVSVVWTLRYTAPPHRVTILDLESGRTTAVFSKRHEGTPINHIARLPQATQAVHATRGHPHDRYRHPMTLSFSTLFMQYTVPACTSPPG